MNMTVIISQDVFDTALKSARKINAGAPVEGMAGASKADIIGWLERAWGQIEKAVKMAYLYGREKATDLISAAVRTTDTVLTEAGAQAQEVHAALLGRLRAFLIDLTKGSVQLTPSEYTVSGRAFRLKSISCKHKLVMTGSLSVNLTELFSLVSSGEIEVEAEYAE
jgi:hypothetical protein